MAKTRYSQSTSAMLHGAEVTLLTALLRLRTGTGLGSPINFYLIVHQLGQGEQWQTVDIEALNTADESEAIRQTKNRHAKLVADSQA